jgi:hypothetical protein
VSKPINKEHLREIFIQPPEKEDSRPFLIRLLASIRVSIKGRIQGGKITKHFGVRGGTDF